MEIDMQKHFTLEYWIDGSWYVGRIKEIPGVYSQGETLAELEENIIDAYDMVAKENDEMYPHTNIKTKEIILPH
jgi:predicted RNase H-like HicB family nuclease